MFIYFRSIKDNKQSVEGHRFVTGLADANVHYIPINVTAFPYKNRAMFGLH